MKTTQKYLDLLLNGTLLQPVTSQTLLGVIVNHN